MKPCKITGRVSCKRKTKCLAGLAQIRPQCATCADAIVEILDLEGDVLCELKNLPANKAPAKKGGRGNVL